LWLPDNLRKAEKTAATERATATEGATERATVLESERAATIAALAPWDAKYAAANPIRLSTPSSHMVSRGLVQAVLIDKPKKDRPTSCGLVGTT
jgi:hypothetical protein